MLSAIIALRDEIFEENVHDKEEFIRSVAAKKGIGVDILTPYYELLQTYKRELERAHRTPRRKIPWTDGERALIQYYVEHSNQTKARSFNDLEDILTPTARSMQSIQFDYYSNILKKSEEEPMEDVKEDESMKESQIEAPLTNETTPQQQNAEDIFMYLSSFVRHVQQLKEFNLTDFFKGIALLAELATKNTQQEEQSVLMKKTMEEKDKKIDQLQQELNQILEALQKFDELDPVEKIIKMKEFNDEIKRFSDKTKKA